MPKLFWLSEETILQQVEMERKLSDDTFETKREIIRRRIKLINWQDKPQDKVNINTASSQINTYIALSYADELKVSFWPRNIADDEIADNLTTLAKFDFDEMGLDQLNYQKQFDKGFYWLSLRIFDWFNSVKKVPEVSLQDPLSWYSDPFPTGFSAQDFRWHGFEYETTEEELKMWEGFFNLNDLGEKESSNFNLNETEYKLAAWLNKQTDNTPNKIFNVYYHYTKFNGRWFLAVTDSTVGVLIKFIRFEAVLSEEKKDPTLIPCPIVINYFRPKRGNPFGDSIMDYVEDKQRADSKLFNLQLFKATREALWGDFLYNKNKIKNKAQLTTPTTKKRYISVDLDHNESMDNIMREVPGEKISVDVESMRSLLKREVGLSTWVDNIIQGVRWDKSITARESQTIQQNANLNLALNNKVDSWGEKEFWKMWYRSYQENFDGSEEKIAKLSSGFGTKIVTFKKDEFTTGNDIDIIIENKTDTDAKMEQEKVNIPFYIEQSQDPSKPEIVRLFLQRKVARLMWMPKPEIDFIYRKTEDELKAMDEVAMLNIDMMPKSIEWDEDQLTYLMIYERAIDTPAKAKAMQKRETAYREQLKQQKQVLAAQWQEQNEGWVGQWTLNQFNSNAIAQDRVKGESASVQDI